MMQRYRFIGTYTEFGDRVFSKIGQILEVDDSTYGEMAGRAPFIPDADFRKISFTDDELDRYGECGSRCLAPESFAAKVRQGAIVLQDIRMRLTLKDAREEIAQEELPT